MELRIISLSDLAADPDTGRPVAALDRLDDRLAYARAADELGLDVFTLGEHHSHKFAVASPTVVLATIVGHTERIRLTSVVTVLSALDAVRVYEDLAQLGLVTHGRAEIIAGRSAFAEPFELFGAPMAEYDALFREKLDLLLRLREEKTITYLLHPDHLDPPELALRSGAQAPGATGRRLKWPAFQPAQVAQFSPAPTPGSSPPAPGGGEPGRGRGCRGSVS